MIELSKGESFSLSKGSSSSKFKVGLAWNPNVGASNANHDLDASAFLLRGGRLVSGDDVVYYRNLKHASGAVNHSGDNLTGEGDGDDETLMVDTSKLPSDVDEVAFIVTIHDAVNRRQDFGQISSASASIYSESGEKLVNYSLKKEFASDTAVQFVSLVKKNGEWSVQADGVGHRKNLAEIATALG